MISDAGIHCRTVVGPELGRQIGANFRTTGTTGPEQKLVEWFVGESELQAPNDCVVTLFCEPKLDTGYPDIVVVTWRPSVAADWSHLRILLEPRDLRILQYLVGADEPTYEALREVFADRLDLSLERLLSADLAMFTGGVVRVRDAEEIYATTHIAAIEAKVSDWSGALRQAVVNTWFATDSYVLMPGSACMTMREDLAHAHGVGILSYKVDGLRLDQGTQVPKSYGSWLFNEWVYRAAIFGGWI